MRYVSGGGWGRGVARVGRDSERFSPSLSPAAGGSGAGVGSDRAWLLLGADKAEWAGLGYYYYPSLGYYYTQSWVFSYLSLGYYYYFTHIYYYYYYYYYVIIIIIDFNIWSDVLHAHAQGLSLCRPDGRRLEMVLVVSGERVCEGQ